MREAFDTGSAHIDLGNGTSLDIDYPRHTTKETDGQATQGSDTGTPEAVPVPEEDGTRAGETDEQPKVVGEALEESPVARAAYVCMICTHVRLAEAALPPAAEQIAAGGNPEIVEIKPKHVRSKGNGLYEHSEFLFDKKTLRMESNTHRVVKVETVAPIPPDWT